MTPEPIPANTIFSTDSAMSETMRRYVLHEQADGQLLPAPEETARPEPGPGEILVAIRAAALNYRDVLMKSGKSASSSGGGVVPLSDGAGEIAAVGSGVEGLETGDRVAACFFQEWEDGRFRMRYHKTALGGSVDGMLREFAVLPASAVVKLPEHLSFSEGATLPCAALTAWHSLVDRGGLEAGQTVLALGTGGVSVFALQIAVAAGARAIVTSSSDEKLAKARELGAWQTVNYRETPDWDQAVWEMTEKRGVDHVIEVGGPDTLGRSMNSVATGGHIALIGVLTGFQAPDASLFPLVARNVDLHGIYAGSRAMFERMNEFFAEKQIRPAVDHEFRFEEALDAYDYLQSGKHFGKVVITME